MSGPWSKFYWADWRSDPRLRMCGLAARGLWIEMLALMHEAEPYGHLVVSGNAPTDAQLGVLVGAPSTQVPELLGELERAGVFSRTRKGTIYSRRMLRDEKRVLTAQKNGKTGGNPKLSKQTTNSPLDNPPLKAPDKPQRPEARDQIEKIVKNLSVSARCARPGPNLADPANRKAAWESKIINHLLKTLPPDKASEVVEAYMLGEDWAKARFEQASASLGKRKMQ